MPKVVVTDYKEHKRTIKRAIWHCSDIGYFVYFETGRVPVMKDESTGLWKEAGSWTTYARIRPDYQPVLRRIENA